MHISIKDDVLKLKADKLLLLLLMTCIFFHAENTNIIDKFNLWGTFGCRHSSRAVSDVGRV